MIDYSILSLPKGVPRVVDRIQKKRELEKQTRDCRRAVDARDHRRCFFPGCRAFAGSKHHILARSLQGRWHTRNILSACEPHHRYFKAGLITVVGNPDRGPVRVTVTSLGHAAGLRVPRRAA